MTEAVQIALIAAIASVVGALIALTGVLVSMSNARGVSNLLVKTDEIHAQTNGTLSELTSQLKTANATIAQMHKAIDTIVPTFIQDKKTKPK